MRTAIRKHYLDFLAILGLLVVAAAVSTVILGKQRLALPAWVPVVGKDFFVIEAEMSTAQAVTPGQGQTVNVAGVEVGEIASVKLRDGKAIIGMRMQPKYDRVYKNASVLLRPKTGLKDMVAELTPGTKDAGRLPEGGVIPISQTLPDVNLDEILASLDSDTRDYLQLLLERRRAGAGLGAEGARAGAGDPAPGADREVRARDQRGARGAAAQPRPRRPQLLAADRRARASATRSWRASSRTPTRSSRRWPARTRRCGRSCRSCRARCRRRRRRSGRSRRWPTSSDRRWTRCCPPRGRWRRRCASTRPFLRDTTPIIRDEIRPFTRAALPTVQELRPAMRDLAATTPDLTASFKVVNRLLNEVAYNPPGDTQEGYLFWQSWVNHAGNAIFSTQDAHGPIRRGLVVLSCSTAQLLDSVAQANPQLGTLVELLNAPGPGADLSDGGWLMGQGRSFPRQDRSRWCCSRCRASGCCCSCGSRSAGPCR